MPTLHRAPEKPTFVLGLGAQKAGTTWLQAYLDHFPFSEFGELKEYHIWDGLFVSEFSEFDMRRVPLSLRQRARYLKRQILRRPQQAMMIRRKLQSRAGTYFDHFENILSGSDILLTDDITPSYCALPAEAFSQIKSGFQARGIEVKVIFLMRESVERCLSAIRMYRRNGRSRQGVDINLSDEQALLAYVQSPQALLRANYHNTLETIQKVFDPSDVYIGFYESMFSESELDRLSTFFKVPEDRAFLGKKFNQTSGHSQISASVRQEAEHPFAPVYDYCYAHYPHLRGLWDTHDVNAPT